MGKKNALTGSGNGKAGVNQKKTKKVTTVRL